MSISNSFVFVTLRYNNLSLHQVVNHSSSAIYCGMESDKSTITVSHEYFIKIVFSFPAQSFLNNVKRTKDKMPAEVCRSPGNTPLNRTNCLLWHNTFTIQIANFGLIFNLISSFDK